MADETPETPENETPDAAVEETATEAVAADAAPAAAAPKPAKGEPAVQLSPKERKVAARNRRGKRRGATPEERAEDRKKKAVARKRRREQEREKAKAAKAAAGGAGSIQHAVAAPKGTGKPKTRLGIVTSDKGDKTITVTIDDARRHRKYQKIVRSTHKLHAHDENNDAGTGDRVRVIECRPMSATKRWRLEEVLERAK